MLACHVQPELFIGLPRPVQKQITHPVKCLYLKDITDKLLECFAVSKEELFSKSRKAYIVDARMIICYLALKTENYTCVKLGHIFSVDHSTIVYYRITVIGRMKVDKAYRERVEKAEELLFIL
jgi:chromosomal replication initiation ATPase DnaA